MSDHSLKRYPSFTFWLTCIASAYSLLHFLGQWPFQAVRMLSASEHYYLSQQIASGAALYRDLAYNKTPLTIYLGSLCFLVCQNQLIPSIILVRFLFWALFTAGAWPVFVIAKETLKKNYLAWIAVFLYLGFPFVSHHLAGEHDWHVLMTVFGLFALAVSVKQRFFLSGVFAALAFFSWQPGLVFLIAIIFAQIFPPHSRKLFRIKTTTIGFLSITILFLIYFLIQGNLKDFIELVFISTQNNVQSEFLKGFELIPKYGRMCYSAYNFVMLAGMGGFLIHGFSLLKTKQLSLLTSAGISLFGITTLTLVYSIVDFQHCDDFLVFIPWISLYSVYPVKYLLVSPPKLTGKCLTAVFLLLILSNFMPTFSNGAFLFQRLGTNPAVFELTQQKNSLVRTLADYGFKGSDEITCIETALACFLTEKKNAYNKYVYLLDNYYTDYIREHDLKSAGILFDAISARKPKFVFTMNTLWKRHGQKDWGRKLKALLEDNYDLHEDGRLFIYIRK